MFSDVQRESDGEGGVSSVLDTHVIMQLSVLGTHNRR